MMQVCAVRCTVPLRRSADCSHTILHLNHVHCYTWRYDVRHLHPHTDTQTSEDSASGVSTTTIRCVVSGAASGKTLLTYIWEMPVSKLFVCLLG